MNKVIIITILTLYTIAKGDDTKYTDIEDNLNDFNSVISYKSSKTGGQFVKYEDCTANDSKCEQQQLLNFDDDAVIRLSFTLPSQLANINYRKDVDGEPLDIPSKMKIKFCYDSESTKLRAWRESKEKIDDDKRCKKKFADTFEIKGDEMTVDYKLPSDTPTARFFLTLLVLCEYKNKDDDTYCAMDTTGSLGEFEIKLDKYEKSDDIYVKTEVMDSVSAGLVTGVVIMSCIALTLLVSYFIYDNFLKKNV